MKVGVTSEVTFKITFGVTFKITFRVTFKITLTVTSKQTEKDTTPHKGTSLRGGAAETADLIQLQQGVVGLPAACFVQQVLVLWLGW